MKAVIPAAGMGTRMLPATKSMPKEMLPVVDKPVIQYVVEEAVASGCDEILIVTGRGKRALEDHFDHSFELEHHLREKGKLDVLKQMEDICELADIHYVRQKEPLGLGHAVLCGKQFIGDEPFAVLLGDDIVYGGVPATKQLIDVYEETGSSAVAALRVPGADISRYGVFDIEEELRPGVHKARGLVEKPAFADAPSDLAVMGRYVLTPKVFEYLARSGRGAGGEIQLTDSLSQLAASDALYATTFGGVRLDAGDTMGLIEANLRVGLQSATIASNLRLLMARLLADA